MIKKALVTVALAAALATPAFAQTPMNNSTAAAMTNATTAQSGDKFIDRQQATDWRSSKLVGTSVYGGDNSKIGSVDDVLIGSDGNVRAVVVGVGGFLGVGQKDVAIPFNALNVTRKPDATSIEKISVTFTKDQLKNAPTFAYYEASGSQTTGSSTGNSSTMKH
jgi:ribosomal 30S subunit maturation factor RimM